MPIQFRPGITHLLTLSLLAVLLLASLPSSGYSQSDSLFDCFPLSVGSQWEYQFIHISQSDPNPDWSGITDTGVVTYRVIRKWEYPDSVLWLFRQTRVLHRTVNYSWVITSDSMVVDTTTFLLVELTADRHELFLQRAVYAEYVEFGGSLYNFGFAFWRNMPDSLRTYRFCPVDSTSIALFNKRQYPNMFRATRRIELKKGVGPQFVQIGSTLVGGREGSDFQLLSYHTIASSRDYYPLEVGNRWNYHLTTTEYYTIVDTGNVEIRVLGDSLMPNGRVYACLSHPDMLGASFVRADSDFVYYYSPWDGSESRMYNLRSQPYAIDTTHWYGYYGFLSSVREIVPTSLFGVERTSRRYLLGGMNNYELSLTDGLGISWGEDQGDGAIHVTSWVLRGAVIRGTVYGVVSAVAADKNFPMTFELFQNYPNPFNPSTTIRYAVPKRSRVTLTVFNTLGQQVTRLIDEEIEAGYHELQFHASSLATGVYFYRLQAGDYVQTKKLCVIR